MGDTTTRAAGRTSRRTVVRGAAWSVPLLVVGAPAAQAAVSPCAVATVTTADVTFADLRATCRSRSQDRLAPTIYAGYGRVSLPPSVQVCACPGTRWYRWAGATTTVADFQVEIAGEYLSAARDQYGAPFQLTGAGTSVCRTFALTYRTSASRPYSTFQNAVPVFGNRTEIPLTLTLQQAPAQTGPWTTSATDTASGFAWRDEDLFNTLDFGNCNPR